MNNSELIVKEYEDIVFKRKRQAKESKEKHENQ